MAIVVFNRLTRQKEEFIPLVEGQVKMYVCGPTVYDHAHIGHAKTYISFDVINRYLRYKGYRVRYVQNITDVGHLLDTGEDRILKKAGALALEPMEIVEIYTRSYFEDMDALGVLRPDISPRASGHVPEQIAMTKALIEKGHAYVTPQGDVYFDVTTFPEYGKLSGQRLDELIAGARVEVGEGKRHPADFALWRHAEPEHLMQWDSPWGRGFPGWHIECSAMAMKYLGETLDIHTGGIDLVFPHHENEIAQSEAATGKPFVRYWLHAEHLIVEGEKMSKSLGNFFTLRDLLARGHRPSSIRYLLASVPYRRQFNFTFDGLQQAASSVERLRNFVVRLKTEKFPPGSHERIRERVRQAEAAFENALADDLNTAVALAATFDLVRELNTAADHGELREQDVPAVLAFLEKFDAIFAVLTDDDAAKMRALGFAAASAELSDAEIEALVAERQAARRRRDFQRADEIRAQLAERGIILEDTRDGGVRWKRK